MRSGKRYSIASWLLILLFLASNLSVGVGGAESADPLETLEATSTVQSGAEEVSHSDDYCRVAFSSPLSIEDREDMGEGGFQFLRYLGNGEYVCEVPAQGLELLSSRSDVVHSNPVEARDKLSSWLSDVHGELPIIVIPYRLEDVEDVAERIRSMGSEITRVQSTGAPRIWALVDSATLPSIANIPLVFFIDADPAPRQFMDLITTQEYMGMDIPQLAGFTGSGIMGEVRDGGIEIDHPDLSID
ncbi:MAG: hypothetical protein KAT70_09525 [Thermoplasmata archaeon]|nr:hypothetical protein [Thermoplasmata archaeon]